MVGLGFAYVPKINDYKLLRIIYSAEKTVYEVEVYSLSTDSWRNVDANFQCNIINHLSQADVNGAFHWMVTRSRRDDNGAHYFVLSFDMIEETFGKVILPECYEMNHLPLHKLLTKFWGSLAVIVYSPYQVGKNCDIWVMKEYGNAKSWTKLYSFRNEVDFMVPLDIFDNGEIIMERQTEGELFSLDTEINRMKSLQIFQPARIVKYVESLVSPQARNVSSGSVSAPSCSHAQTGVVSIEQSKSD